MTASPAWNSLLSNSQPGATHECAYMKSKLVILSLTIALAASLAAVYCLADDAFERCERHGESKNDDHERKGEKHGENGSTPTAADGAYAAACGSCHWAYAPQLLPKKSWENTLASLGDHFGSEVALSEQQKKTVSSHLLSGAADVSSSELGRKVARSLGGAAPARITEVPYLQKEHRELAPEVLARKGVGGLANCIACHPGAASLDFEDDRVRIPAK